MSTGKDRQSDGTRLTNRQLAMWANRLPDVLERLSVDQQDALRLRYIERLPSKKIAEKLGKTDGAVRVMLARSLAKLQALLGESRRISIDD